MAGKLSRRLQIAIGSSEGNFVLESLKSGELLLAIRSRTDEKCLMKDQPNNQVVPQHNNNPTPTSSKKAGLLLSVQKIQEIATREQLTSDGGGTGRSDTNDNKLNTV